MIKTGKNKDKAKVNIYKTFMQMANLKSFSRLMTSESSTKKVSFYQMKNKNINEYLLVQTNTIIYVTETIDLKSIGEFEQIMEIAESTFEM